MKIKFYLFVATPLMLASLSNTWAMDKDAFEQHVLPLIHKHCLDCHNDNEDSGSISFTSYQSFKSVKQDLLLWEKVAGVISRSEMPPEDSGDMPPDDRKLVVDFVHRSIELVNREGQKDVPPGMPRRLTRSEYANTIRDLLGVELDAQTFLPEDKVGATGFRNDNNELNMSPELLERYWMLADKVVGQAIQRDASTQDKRLLLAQPSDALSRKDAAKQIIEAFGRRAFRRPLTRPEVDQYAALSAKLDEAEATFEFSVSTMAKAILVSPHFLFRIEAMNPTLGVTSINDFELVTRLSYLIWSSCPDDELLRLAEEMRLSDPNVLVSQIQRMLVDERAGSLADEFVEQWLFSKVTQREPDPVVYPTYTKELHDAAGQELKRFVSNLFRADRSLMELIDADYTFVNSALAEHYGIEVHAIDADSENEWHRVVLKPDHHRGGLLGMARILQRTSMSDRTSPTVRGAWVLDAILGTPPPPPPPDVNNTLDQEDKGTGRALTFREKLEAHANESSTCAGCHKKMDPIGFSMDNFDGIGRWRQESFGQPLQTSGTMTDGRELSGIADLKSVLMDRKRQIVRNVVERFLSYALGREVTGDDFASVNAITDEVIENDCRASSLIVAAAKSYPFTHKKHPASVVVSQ
jgi:hypothetical protein